MSVCFVWVICVGLDTRHGLESTRYGLLGANFGTISGIFLYSGANRLMDMASWTVFEGEGRGGEVRNNNRNIQSLVFGDVGKIFRGGGRIRVEYALSRSELLGEFWGMGPNRIIIYQSASQPSIHKSQLSHSHIHRVKFIKEKQQK